MSERHTFREHVSGFLEVCVGYGVIAIFSVLSYSAILLGALPRIKKERR